MTRMVGLVPAKAMDLGVPCEQRVMEMVEKGEESECLHESDDLVSDGWGNRAAIRVVSEDKLSLFVGRKRLKNAIVIRSY